MGQGNELTLESRETRNPGGSPMGSMIDFKRPDGSSCKGYLSESGKGKPGIIVLQEWWGLNDQIKEIGRAHV